MTISGQIVLSVITALGIGGILGSYFQSLFQHHKQIKDQKHDLKFKRYGCILILLLTKLDPQSGLPHMKEIRPDLHDIKEIEKEIEVELLNAVLYAGDGVIKALSDFIRNPNYASYISTAAAIRKDLWGNKTSIKEQDINILKERSHDASV